MEIVGEFLGKDCDKTINPNGYTFFQTFPVDPTFQNKLLYRSCLKIEFQTRRRPEFKPDPVGAEAVQIE